MHYVHLFFHTLTRVIVGEEHVLARSSSGSTRVPEKWFFKNSTRTPSSFTHLSLSGRTNCICVRHYIYTCIYNAYWYCLLPCMCPPMTFVNGRRGKPGKCFIKFIIYIYILVLTYPKPASKLIKDGNASVRFFSHALLSLWSLPFT